MAREQHIQRKRAIMAQPRVQAVLLCMACVALLALATGGCSGRQEYAAVQQRWHYLREGMSTDAVRDLLGKPQRVETLQRERQELLHWTYGGRVAAEGYQQPLEMYFDQHERLRSWTQPKR